MTNRDIARLNTLFTALEPFPRPTGDNDGDAWNAPSIYPYLPPEAQEIVDEIEDVARGLLIRQGNFDQEANTRGVNLARANGYRADFGPAQHNPNRNVGLIGRGDPWIDLSDPRSDADGRPA